MTNEQADRALRMLLSYVPAPVGCTHEWKLHRSILKDGEREVIMRCAKCREEKLETLR